MKITRLLLDHTFMQALTEATSPNHATAVATFRRLLERFVDDEVQLFAGDHDMKPLAKDVRKGLLAAVDTLHTSRLHARVAATLEDRVPAHTDRTLVLARYENLVEIASFDPELLLFDVRLSEHHHAD